MFRPISMAVVAAIALGPAARGQGFLPGSNFSYFGPGSTAEGDYLRGVGIAADGLGSYNLKTSMAESINADTAIKIDRYMGEIFHAGRQRYAELLRRKRERFRANFEAIRRRIMEQPEQPDIMSGQSLNGALDALNNLNLDPSSYRLAASEIPIDAITKIPFQRGDKGITFSMRRLMAQGPDRWPTGLLDDRFAAERRRFDQAFEDAYERIIEGNIQESSIVAYEQAVVALGNRINEVYGATNRDIHVNEARTHARGLKDAAKLLKESEIRPALVELEHFQGRTVNDLRLFMQRHHLRFASVATPDERSLYPDLYAALVQAKSDLEGQPKESIR